VEVSARRVGDVAVLEVAGKVLGGPESDALRDALEEVLSRGDRKLLVDLSGVPWMNSAGLGILLAAYSRMRERGGVVRLSGVGDRVRGILHTTKLLTVLEVVDDESSGIRSFAGGSAVP
jgi:anti-sigma B factor antagonist